MLTHELHQRSATLTLRGLWYTWQTSVLEMQGQCRWKTTRKRHSLLQSHKHPSAGPLVMTWCVKYATGTRLFVDALKYMFDAWRASLPSLTYILWKVSVHTFSDLSEPLLNSGSFKSIQIVALVHVLYRSSPSSKQSAGKGHLISSHFKGFMLVLNCWAGLQITGSSRGLFFFTHPSLLYTSASSVLLFLANQ